MRDLIEFALHDGGGVICRRERPDLATALDWQLRTGALVAVLPGVYARPDHAASFECRVRALAARDHDAVLTGAAAARVSFWPGIRVTAVGFAGSPLRTPVSGFAGCRRRLPVEWIRVRDRVRYTDPALTALDLCDELGGDGIDTALRTRATTLALLRAALEATPNRRGNRRRRALLLDSRDEPWSAAERLLHRLLRAAGLRGWQANAGVVVEGRICFLDVAFAAARLAIEVDGRGVHGGADAFENDRARQNALVLAGWRVLRFTWLMLRDEPGAVVAAIRRALLL